MAIIGILASLLLPSLSKAREKAKQMMCLSNQRNFTQATMLLGKSKKMKIPRGAKNDGPSGNAFTLYAIRKQLGINESVSSATNTGELKSYFSKNNIYHCPSFDKQNYSLHYIVNSMDFTLMNKSGIQNEIANRRDSAGWNFVDSSANPSATSLFVEMNDEYLGPNDLSSMNIWKYSDLPYNSSGGKQLLGRMMSPVDQRHLGRTAVAYIDGHVQLLNLNSSGQFLPVGFIDGSNF